MTGAEHYEEAEQILARAEDASASMVMDDMFGPEEQREVLASAYSLAQVHATLALVQATLVQFEKEDWGKPVETADVSPAYL